MNRVGGARSRFPDTLVGGLIVGVVASCAGSAGAQVGSVADQEQARIRAERQAAERASREAAPVVSLSREASPIGPFPIETPCFPVGDVVVENIDREALRWVEGFAARYVGRCVGVQALSYIVRDLQAAFIERGLVTTRAGLPEQDLATGTLRIVVVPGVVEDIRINRGDNPRVWVRATPVGRGDLLDLRALEQGLEQLRSVPGRTATVDILPGDTPGGSILDVALAQRRPIAGSLSINNFASERVGRYQGSGQIAELGLLGFSEVISAYYNRRADAPGIPADSQGYGVTAAVPLGWWTLTGAPPPTATVRPWWAKSAPLGRAER